MWRKRFHRFRLQWAPSWTYKTECYPSYHVTTVHNKNLTRTYHVDYSVFVCHIMKKLATGEEVEENGLLHN